eukprot:3056629-Amphidinium_carterae.1
MYQNYILGNLVGVWTRSTAIWTIIITTKAKTRNELALGFTLAVVVQSQMSCLFSALVSNLASHMLNLDHDLWSGSEENNHKRDPEEIGAEYRDNQYI